MPVIDIIGREQCSTVFFFEIAALLLTTAVIGAIGVRLHQPLIVPFITVGILAGPGWVTATDQVDLLAKIGIALLLFVVGLKRIPNRYCRIFNRQHSRKDSSAGRLFSFNSKAGWVYHAD